MSNSNHSPVPRCVAEQAVMQAYRDGYDTASDPSWCNKQLRRAGIHDEAWQESAREHFLKEELEFILSHLDRAEEIAHDPDQ